MSLETIKKWKSERKFYGIQEDAMIKDDDRLSFETYNYMISKVKHYRKINLIPDKIRSYKHDDTKYQNVDLTKMKKTNSDTILYINSNDIDEEYCYSTSNASFNYTYLTFERFVVRNFRIDDLNLLNNVERIVLQIGGCRIDCIYPEIFPQLRQLYGIKDKHILPFHFFTKGIKILKYHEIKLIFNLKKYCSGHFNPNVSIELGELDVTTYSMVCNYTTYNLGSNQQVNNGMETLLFQVCTNATFMNKRINKSDYDNEAHLYLYNLTYYIICNKQIRDVVLVIKIDDKDIILELPQENNIIKLAPSNNVNDLIKSGEYLEYGLNMSCINHCLIRYNYVNEKDKNSKKEEDRFYGINHQQIRIMSGMAGLVWAT